jgi:hypothetical protein
MSANEHPKISVIVPTLNVEALLDNVLSSIARKRCIFSKLFFPDGVFPVGLVSDSWRRYFSATVSKQPEESRQGE